MAVGSLCPGAYRIIKTFTEVTLPLGSRAFGVWVRVPSGAPDQHDGFATKPSCFFISPKPRGLFRTPSPPPQSPPPRRLRTSQQQATPSPKTNVLCKRAKCPNALPVLYLFTNFKLHCVLPFTPRKKCGRIK